MSINIGKAVIFYGVGGPHILGKKLDSALAKFVPVKIDCSPLNFLSPGDREAVLKLVEASRVIHEIYWRQVSPEHMGLRDSLKGSIDPVQQKLLRFLNLHCGPYDTIGGLKSILDGEKRPEGAGFYTQGVTSEEIEKHAAIDTSIKADNTVVKRLAKGGLITIPYVQEYHENIQYAARILYEAKNLAKDQKLKVLLEHCALALESGNYKDKDEFWVNYDGLIDFILGHDERYDDKLMGLKGAFQAAVLLKDIEETRTSEGVLSLANKLQKSLPVSDDLKDKKVNLRLAVYNLLYSAGKKRTGPKTIGTSLPNDEEVKSGIGQRVLLFKNIIDAKFHKILEPISKEVIASDQLEYIDEYAFYVAILLHEVAHALGIDYISEKEKSEENKIRNVLGGGDKYNILEEAKADMVGLYSLPFLIESGIFEEKIRKQVYVTFVASLFRAARFGVASAHGRAAMLQLNYLSSEENRAIICQNGKVEVNIENMQKAIAALTKDLLEIEGYGDNERAIRLIKDYGEISPSAQQIIDRLVSIPVDLDYEFEDYK